MLTPKERTCTLKNIYALPEGQRAELIDGQIYDMAPPDWITDPGSGNVMVYDFANGDSASYTFNDTIPVGIYQDTLSLKIALLLEAPL